MHTKFNRYKGWSVIKFNGHDVSTVADLQREFDAVEGRADRVTFTLSTLQNSLRVCFVATGESKTPVLKEILARKEGKLDYAYPVPPYPAAWVRSADGGAQWFLDSAAGGGL